MLKIRANGSAKVERGEIVRKAGKTHEYMILDYWFDYSTAVTMYRLVRIQGNLPIRWVWDLPEDDLILDFEH